MRRRRVDIRRQPALRGITWKDRHGKTHHGRMPTYAGLAPEIRSRLEAVAERSQCSIPLVVTTILADGLGIELATIERYDYVPKRKAV